MAKSAFFFQKWLVYHRLSGKYGTEESCCEAQHRLRWPAGYPSCPPFFNLLSHAAKLERGWDNNIGNKKTDTGVA
jgi:hypothetical protein